MKKLMPTEAVKLELGRKYLFVFDYSSGMGKQQIEDFLKLLKTEGYTGIALQLKDASGLTVFEQQV